MTEAQMREQVISVYPGVESWRKKVLKMKFQQVYAVWLRFKREERID